MKPLLRPARPAHRDLLTNALGITGCARIEGLAGFKSSAERILTALGSLTSSDRSCLDEELCGTDTLLRTYNLESRRDGTMTCAGIVSLAYNQQSFSLGARIEWSHLPIDIEAVTRFTDRLWRLDEWLVLYAYDQDDFSVQNTTSVPGMEHWGIDRDQVEIINRSGLGNEIDTQANPGFMLNRDGLLSSVQWLNYWSAAALGRMFTAPPEDFPAGVEISHLDEGAIRMRLGVHPGRIDDIDFHKLPVGMSIPTTVC